MKRNVKYIDMQMIFIPELGFMGEYVEIAVK